MTLTRRAAALAPRDRRALATGLVAMAVILGYALVFRPALRSLRDETALLNERRALLGRERSLLATMPNIKSAQSRGTRVFSASGGRLFVGDTVAATAALTAWVAEAATGAGVRLVSIDARPPATSHELSRLAVDARGEGRWKETLAFLHGLESADRLVDVTEVRIERGPRGGPLGGDLVTFTATIAGYTLVSWMPPGMNP